jgi:hypothetical protein
MLGLPAVDDLLDWSVVRLCNLGQLDVSTTLQLPTLPPPPPPPGAELLPAGSGADISEAVLAQVAALLAHADISYVCVAHAPAPRACTPCARVAVHACAHAHAQRNPRRCLLTRAPRAAAAFPTVSCRWTRRAAAGRCVKRCWSAAPRHLR